MTSLSRKRRARYSAPPVGACSAEREGIFDQFSEESIQEIFYYTAYGRSDAKGNFTLDYVRRGRFDSDFNPLPLEADEPDDDVESSKEGSEEEEKRAANSKKIYGFRTRRLKTKRSDEEFDTSLCNTSDESADDERENVAQSDDETYDITADNWTFVRGGKKKTPEKRKKANDAPNRGKILPKSPTVMKIRLKSLANKTKLQKFASKLRKRGVVPTKPKIQAMDTRTKSARRVPKKHLSPPKVAENTAKELQNEKNETTPNVGNKSPVEDALSRSLFLKSVVQSASLITGPFSQKSPTRIRCGYNPTAPQIPSQIPHVRRRQLRQPLNGISKSDPSAFDDGSTSSEEDTAIAQKTRGKRLSRMRRATRTRGAQSTSTATPTDGRTEKKQGGENVTVTSSGSGLKVVIRKNSVEQHIRSAAPQPGVKSPADVQSPEPDMHPVPEGSSKSELTTKLEESATASPDIKYLVLSTVKVQPSDISDKTEGSTTCSSVLEMKPASEDTADHLTEVNSGTEESGKSPEETTSCETKPSSTVSSLKSTCEEEVTKKKKSKKKRKKDRGRDGNSAGTGDAFDAEHTAMRLAMEFPRHNWLVKHLIKENKIKAEDDKPINLTEGEEGSPTQPPTDEILKLRATQAVGGSLKQPHKETQLLRPDPEFVESQPRNLSQRDAAPKPEETRTEELRKVSNGSKGSSMVGIVKPFQHLKMFPMTMDAAEMSPPSLCIVDEEEAVTSHATANSNSSLATPCSVPTTSNTGSVDHVNGYTHSSKSEGFQMTGILATSQGTQKSFVTQNDVAATSSRRQINPSVPVTTVNVAETVRGELQKLQHPNANACINNVVMKTMATQVTRDDLATVGPPKNEQKPGDVKAAAEAEPEMHISSCFPLALDLTKPVEKKVEQPVNHDNNLPLDLSLGPRSGDISPKVLDLSVKKPTQNTTDSEKAVFLKKSLDVTSLKTGPSNVQSHPPPKNVLPEHARIPTPTISKTQLPNDVPEPNADVIIIEDDSPDNKNKPLYLATPPPAMMLDKIRPSQPPTRTPTGVEKDLGQGVSVPMKRCASHELPLSQTSQEPALPKRARMSLDDSKRTRITAHRSPQKIIQSPPRQFLTPPKRRNSDMVVETRVQRSNEGTPKPTEAPENKKMVDMLGVNKLQLLENITTDRKLSPKNRLQPSISGLPIGGSRPSLPIPRPALLTRSSSSMPIPPANYSGQVSSRFSTVIPNRLPTPYRAPCDPAQRRTARHRSLESSNATAHLVAQAYQPNMRHLGPYIKVQQIAVDKKIQELEAIKHQLANAQTLNSGVLVHSPPFTQSRSIRPQIRPAFTPPTQVPSTLVQKALPHHPQATRLPQIPKPTMLPSSAQSSVSIPSFQMQQSPIARSGTPRHARPVPVIQAQQRRPPQSQASLTWRSQRPHSELMLNRPRLVYQRSASNGVLNLPVNQTPIRRSNQPHMPSPHGVRYARIPVSIEPTIPSRPPPAYRPLSHPAITRMQSIPVPRTPATTTTPPFYRNGGLTVRNSFKTKLSEPIVIEDDNTRHSAPVMSLRKRPGSQAAPESLKVRRAHSYHPPLSKNRYDAPVPQPISSQRWSEPRIPSNVKGPRPHAAEVSEKEICVRCREKAFFLCSGCRKMWYCSKKCQLQDWTVHSTICVG